jgi:hypothetical protein
MVPDNWHSSRVKIRAVIFILIAVVMLVFIVSASSNYIQASIQAPMGSVINLHGVAYTGNEVYLFMIGPNLPTNGVPLNDINQRADQGAFTMVDVDSNQQWSYSWDTSRFQDRLDYGSYTVYAVTDPVDLSRLDDHPYNTISITLIRPGLTYVGTSGGSAYTLNPENPTSAQTPQITSLTTTVPTLLPTTVIPATTLPNIPSQIITQKSGGIADAIMLILVSLISVLLFFHRRQKNFRN